MKNLKKHLISYVLLLIAILMAIFFFPVFILYYLFKQIKVRGYKMLALTIALTLDILGNVIGEELLNDKLKTSEGYRFGTSGQTISAVLGFNQELGTLTRSGQVLANTLDWIDKNHCYNAMESYKKENK